MLTMFLLGSNGEAVEPNQERFGRLGTQRGLPRPGPLTYCGTEGGAALLRLSLYLRPYSL